MALSFGDPFVDTDGVKQHNKSVAIGSLIKVSASASHHGQVGKDIVALKDGKDKKLLFHYLNSGARRRRSGGGPGGEWARMPVGSYLYFHAVGVGIYHIAVPCMHETVVGG
jgi:hypothetical protein